MRPAWNDTVLIKRLLDIGTIPAPEAAEALRAQAAVFGMPQVIHLPSLPLDRRHNAKIDYPALRALLESAKPVNVVSASP